MRSRVVLVCALALAALGGGVPSAGATAGWRAGAAKVDITPPRFDPRVDAAAFPAACRLAFDGPRPFAFEEPYKDVDRSGSFEYGRDTFCDANHNGRWDGIYLSGGTDHLARRVHDPIDARAVAFSDGRKTAVIVSVTSLGLFENYTHRIRRRAQQLRPGITDVIVSSNHNESSPDPVGINGPTADGDNRIASGIDDYYMSFLVDRVALAAARAYDRLRPATLWARQYPIPRDLRVQLSYNFPTTNDDKSPAAIDPKIGLLQARNLRGRPIFTIMSLAAHNQEIGHSRYAGLRYEVSADWPGYFHRRSEALGKDGMPVFLVGDNGSIEDPETVPPVSATEHPECRDEGCYAQARATGRAFAAALTAQARRARRLRFGTLVVERREFFAPVENNLFRAAGALGLFGERQFYTAGVPTGRVGTDLRTEVGVLDLGPDLQFIANPGEAFPALMVGSPWGIEEAGCPERPNPPVPTWHARAPYRFQIGLADDLIGYMSPAWGFSSETGVYVTTCNNDMDDRDPRGHQHKLEDEGVGPTAGNLVAENVTALLDKRPDPAARIRRGRFVRRDGTLSRRAEGAVAIWLADPGSGKQGPGRGTLVALRGISAFGTRRVDRTGAFMDYDGVGQARSDITTRGMLVRRACGGRVLARYYVDVYPALSTATLGRARRTATRTPSCRRRRPHHHPSRRGHHRHAPRFTG